MIYSVSLEKDQGLLSGFPTLLSKGYILGFYFEKLSNGKFGKDERVFLTISKIIMDHFKEFGEETVLLYYCDNEGNRQRGRHVLFEKWYKQSEFAHQIIKEGVEAIVPIDGQSQDYYFGYITPKGNPNIQAIKDEFELFSSNILYREIDKSGNANED